MSVRWLRTLHSIAAQETTEPPNYTEGLDTFFNDIMPRIIMMGMVFAVFVILVMMLTWPFRKGTAGLMDEGFVGVVYRFREFVDNKTICPVDVDGNRIDAKRSLPWILDRAFWRHPIKTLVLRANVQWEDVSTDPGARTSIVLEGAPIDFEIRGFGRMFSPTYLAKTFNVRGTIEGEDQSMQTRFDVAVRKVRYTVLSTAITTVLSQFEGLTYERLKHQAPDLLAEINRRVDEIGMQFGFRFRDIRFENMNPQENVARDLAAPMLVGPAVEAAILHATSIIGPGGELDRIEESLRSRNPGWTDDRVRQEALELLKLIAARQGGKGYDLTIPSR